MGLPTASTAPPSDVLTFADLLRAEAMLNAQNVPRFGGHVMFLPRCAHEDVVLDWCTMGTS